MDKETYYGVNECSTVTINNYNEDIDTIIVSSIDNNYWSAASDFIDLNNITIVGTLFEDTMPDAYEVTEMCKEYPALEKAYENFKTIYKMVEQDWIGKQKEQDT